MKKKYKIDVDCANCANLMEDAVSRLDGINSVSVNFIMQKMLLDIDDAYNCEGVIDNVIKVCKKVEPDCKIYL